MQCLNNMQLIYLIVLYCGLATAVQDVNLDQKWSNFKQSFGKSFKNVMEENERYKTFKQNLAIITKHNKRYENGEVSYKMGLNNFSDMSFEEVERNLMGFKMSDSNRDNVSDDKIFKPTLTLRDVPDSWDWRDYGAVTDVKNQNNCGCCWAFASVAALESHYFIKYKELLLLSEQNLLDCVQQNGCNGSDDKFAFSYVYSNGGIDTETFYPYQGEQNPYCYFDPANVGATCQGYDELPNGDENALMEAVATIGPMTAHIHATPSFINFHSGFYDDPSCGKDLNHAMLLVGYGSENGRDYWLLKNSWGTHWGENGYVKMARNKDNQCGIGLISYYPVM